MVGVDKIAEFTCANLHLSSTMIATEMIKFEELIGGNKIAMSTCAHQSLYMNDYYGCRDKHSKHTSLHRYAAVNYSL